MTATAFLVAAALHLAAAISPGPSFVVAVRTAAAEGFRTAAALALGLGLGAAVWALAALSGLAMLFELAPALLTAAKLVGGLVLVWIAVQTWRHASEPIPAPETGIAPRSIGGAVRLGLLTQLANPKPAIFFGAVFVGVVPQQAPGWALALLVGLILMDETLWYVLVARLFSGRRARRVYAGAKGWVDRGFGGLIAAFGVRIALP